MRVAEWKREDNSPLRLLRHSTLLLLRRPSSRGKDGGRLRSFRFSVEEYKGAGGSSDHKGALFQKDLRSSWPHVESRSVVLRHVLFFLLPSFFLLLSRKHVRVLERVGSVGKGSDSPTCCPKFGPPDSLANSSTSTCERKMKVGEWRKRGRIRYTAQKTYRNTRQMKRTGTDLPSSLSSRSVFP